MFIQVVGVQDFDATRSQLTQEGIEVVDHEIEYLDTFVQGQKMLRENDYIRSNDAE